MLKKYLVKTLKLSFFSHFTLTGTIGSPSILVFISFVNLLLKLMESVKVDFKNLLPLPEGPG